MLDQSVCETAIEGFSLTDQSRRRLIAICQELHDFEKTGKAQQRTKAQRLKQVLEIEKAATELRGMLDRLELGDWLSIDTGLLLRAPGPEVIPCAIGQQNQLGSHASYMQRMICTLAGAARHATHSLTDGKDPKTIRGRKSTLGVYAGFVACMAAAVKVDGIVPGRGGDFERLCEAIFSCAGVPAKPEGALKRYLVDVHDEYVKMGHVLGR